MRSAVMPATSAPIRGAPRLVLHAVADLVDRHLKLGDVNEGVTLDDLEEGPV
jgi:hypothetical protein